MQYGQKESGGFAAAGLARHHQVDESGSTFGSALHRQGNGLALNSGRLGEAQVSNSLHQFRREAQCNKPVGFDLNYRLGHQRRINRCHRQCLRKIVSRLAGKAGRRFQGNDGAQVTGLGRREVTRHRKCVSHFFLTREQRLREPLPRQWLRKQKLLPVNINHQTEPAPEPDLPGCLQGSAFGTMLALGACCLQVLLNQLKFETLESVCSPVSEGRCANAQVSQRSPRLWHGCGFLPNVIFDPGLVFAFSCAGRVTQAGQKPVPVIHELVN